MVILYLCFTKISLNSRVRYFLFLLIGQFTGITQVVVDSMSSKNNKNNKDDKNEKGCSSIFSINCCCNIFTYLFKDISLLL